MTNMARRFGLVAVAFVDLLGAAGCTGSNDAGPAVPVDPMAIYSQMCARCHGLDGRGDPAMKAMMPVRDFTDPAFLPAVRSADGIESVIMSGRNQMPGFGGALSMPKIQAVAGLVRRLAVR